MGPWGSLDAAHAEILNFDELVDAVFGALAAHVYFLHATERASSVEMIPTLMPTMPLPYDTMTLAEFRKHRGYDTDEGR